MNSIKMNREIKLAIDNIENKEYIARMDGYIKENKIVEYRINKNKLVYKVSFKETDINKKCTIEYIVNLDDMSVKNRKCLFYNDKYSVNNIREQDSLEG